MELLKSQTVWTTTVNLGDSYNESVSQSFYFDRPFSLYAVVVRFTDMSVDPLHDVKFRCEARGAKGTNLHFRPKDEPLIHSPWYTDSKISIGEFTFIMPTFTLDAGGYFFSIVPNMRVPYGSKLAIYEGGSGFWGKFIKWESGTGVYRTDTSLMIKIYGDWAGYGIENKAVDSESYITTTLRDETS